MVTVIELDSFDALSDVLHDAELAGMCWTADQGRLSLGLRCLRRDPGGSSGAAELGPVTLTLDGVSALGVSFEPAQARPSSVQLPAPEAVLATVASQATRRRFEVWVRRNREWQDDAISAVGLGWIAGNTETFTSASDRFVITVQVFDALGPPGEVYLLMAATRITAADASGPLALAEWKRQFDAWWKEWSRSEEVVDADDLAAHSPEDEQPERQVYRPPAEPIVALMPSDTPGDLVAPVAAWFESQHRTEPDCFDWPYARAIDSWWMDGPRAQVVVRGIEHSAPAAGYRAENREVVWTLSLRKRSDGWGVAGLSVGVPLCGSATRIPNAAKPWLRTWRGGRLKNRRTLREVARRTFRPAIYLYRVFRE